MKLIEAIVQNDQILHNVHLSPEQLDFAEKRQKIIEDLLPSGSGFDNGTSICDVSEKMVSFSTAFHVMDENGYYDGWENYRIFVKPSFMYGMTVFVKGKNRNGLKDYIEEVFGRLLESEFDWKYVL